MSMAGRKEVPHFLLHLGPTTLSAYIVNRQENNTRSADTVARLAQAYILCSPYDQPSYFFVKMSQVYFF